MTGPLILATFGTPEGSPMIKSELIDRISAQTRICGADILTLYREFTEAVD